MFVPENILSKVKADQSVRRKRRTWQKSKINKFIVELIKLKEAGGSYAQLALWLRKEKRIKIHRSNIKRAIDKFKKIANQEI
jgi:IS30 family transposase